MTKSVIDFDSMSYDTPTFVAASKFEVELAAQCEGVNVRVTDVDSGCLVQLVDDAFNWWFYGCVMMFVATWTALIWYVRG